DWDRYQTVVDHVYPNSGLFKIWFVVFRKTINGFVGYREVGGTAYVDITPPKAPPVTSAPIGTAILDTNSHNGLSAASFSLNTKNGGEWECTANVSLPSGPARQEIIAAPCTADPYLVVVAGVLELVQKRAACEGCRMLIEF